MTHSARHRQRGGFVMGLVAGLLVGLALALAVALYITKAPVPFIDKVPQRTAEQDKAEVEKNRSWDPNALLGGKPAKPLADPAAASAAAAASAVAALPPVVASGPTAKPAARDPAAILAGAPTPPAVPPAKPAADPFIYFVQAGAYTRPEDAEQQKAKLAMLGQEAKVSEREQAGRTVYRVRVGPFPTRDVADDLQGRLQQQSIESQIVRVERP
jgi:cell division protein FtsN